MNKVSKRIIACLSAMAIALALVVAAVPANEAQAEELQELGTRVGRIASIYNTGTVLDSPQFRTGSNNGKTYYYSLLQRVPDENEIDNYVYATIEDTWTYDASAFPLTMEADTTYYVLVKCVADEGNSFNPEIHATIIDATESGEYGLYNVNKPNDTFYYWFAYKTNPSEPVTPTDPESENATTNTSQDAASPATTDSTSNTSAGKAKSPKTSDEFPFVPVVMLVVGASAIGVVAVRRRKM